MRKYTQTQCEKSMPKLLGDAQKTHELVYVMRLFVDEYLCAVIMDQLLTKIQ